METRFRIQKVIQNLIHLTLKAMGIPSSRSQDKQRAEVQENQDQSQRQVEFLGPRAV